jgi:hypothetical protein
VILGAKFAVGVSLQGKNCLESSPHSWRMFRLARHAAGQRSSQKINLMSPYEYLGNHMIKPGRIMQSFERLPHVLLKTVSYPLGIQETRTL